MSGDVNLRRSQAILRLPVDNVLAKLVLHDGERSDVLLFIPPGEQITALVSPGDPFVPMIRDARYCLVARDAIAALGVVVDVEPPDEGALPIERRRARIRLRSGALIEGELRWTATNDPQAGADGQQRTAAHVNDAARFLVIHATEPATTYYVAKAQIATVEDA